MDSFLGKMRNLKLRYRFVTNESHKIYYQFFALIVPNRPHLIPHE